jgi:uncharacterized delta-60 repeat protein
MFPPLQHPLRLAALLLLIACNILLGASAARAAVKPDATFNPLVTNGVGQIFAVAVQADGKVLVGGDFVMLNNVARSRIARLNADGTLDTTFNPAPGADGQINAVAVQADGKIVIGGQFGSVNNVTHNNLARLNADGSLDTTFNPSTNLSVFGIALQADQRIAIVGDFTVVNGATRNRVAQLNPNGTLDTTFAPASGISDTAVAVAPQSDGKLLVGGGFTTVNGATHNFLARLNTDGSTDTAFNPTANTVVWAVSILPDQRIALGGDFTSVNSTARGHVAQLNPNGTLDTTFAPAQGANGLVRGLALQPDGKVVIGGSFSSVNNNARNCVARLNTNGSTDTTFAPAVTGGGGTVSAIAVQPDGKVVIGGTFTSVNGVTRTRVARLGADGSLDTSFNPGAGANNEVRTIVVQPDGKILIGGFFTTYNNNVSRNTIARLNADGSLDTSFNPGTGTNGVVHAIAVQADGGIIIAGEFTTYNNVARFCIARLSANGSLDTAYNPALNSAGVYCVALQPDGKLVIGGDFGTINGRVRIARLNTDGTLDTNFNPGTGVNSLVYAVALQADGKVLIGGEFTGVNGVARLRIARLNMDGSLDASFSPVPGASSTVRAIVAQPDGHILIGGIFTAVNSVLHPGLARLNSVGAVDADFNAVVSAPSTVYAIARQADGKVLVGGLFSIVNNTPHVGLARLVANIPTAADFDGDTRADISVWNPVDHNWYILQSRTNTTRVQLDWGNGSLGDKAVPGDYDRDGQADFAVWRGSEGNWYILGSATNIVDVRGWGISTDTPVPADYDGDGITDIAVWRGDEGNWYIIGSTSGGSIQSWGIGALGDIPVPADYDGDGRADLAVFRASEGNWYIIKSNNGSPVGTVQQWGGSGDKLVPADYDGDGRADIAIFRPAEGNWYIINSATGAVTLRGWGAGGDIPVPADYDGDGRADIAVFRPTEGNWYIIRSSIGAGQVQYLGGASDVPTSSAYLPQ